MVHGLCGSHESPYLVRLAKKFYKQRMRTIRINLKGCGSGKGHAKRIYHVDSSHDIWYAVDRIKKETPDTEIIVVGFSLGGNVVLKMAGEQGKRAKQRIRRIIAVSPPIDMQSSAKLLSKSRLYERYFMRCLRADILFLHTQFDDLPPLEVPNDMTLKEFDEFYIAPQSGYGSAKEFYGASSSGRLIPDICVETYILFSQDDPIVDHTILETVELPANIEIKVTKQGGHMGYLGVPGKGRGFYWLDATIMEWVRMRSSA